MRCSGIHAPHTLFSMKSSFIILLLFSALQALVAGFTQDHEIFKLRDEVEASEGPGVNFYGIPSFNQMPLHPLIRAFQMFSA